METSIITLTKEQNLRNLFIPRTKRGEICDVFVCVDERKVANFSAENSLSHLSRLPAAAAQFRGHPSARQTRHLPEEELPRLHGEPVLQREQHHRPGKETQAADPQRGEFDPQRRWRARCRVRPERLWLPRRPVPVTKGPFKRCCLFFR